jgi:hypothetical protein
MYTHSPQESERALDRLRPLVLGFTGFIPKRMATSFVDRPAGKLALVNSVIALGLFVAYRHGQRGLDLLFLSIVSIVALNAVAFFSILFGRKAVPGSPNKFLKPLWVAVGIIWLIYLLDYMFPLK